MKTDNLSLSPKSATPSYGSIRDALGFEKQAGLADAVVGGLALIGVGGLGALIGNSAFKSLTPAGVEQNNLPDGVFLRPSHLEGLTADLKAQADASTSMQHPMLTGALSMGLVPSIRAAVIRSNALDNVMRNDETFADRVIPAMNAEKSTQAVSNIGQAIGGIGAMLGSSLLTKTGGDFMESAAGSAVGTTAALGAVGYGAYKMGPNLIRGTAGSTAKRWAPRLLAGAAGLGLAAFGARKFGPGAFKKFVNSDMAFKAKGAVVDAYGKAKSAVKDVYGRSAAAGEGLGQRAGQSVGQGIRRLRTAASGVSK